MNRTFRSGFLGRLAGDRRGVSAIEFALLAPVMIAFYFAVAEFCQAYMAQKRTGHAASMVADLVSQTNAVTTGELDDIFGIGDLVMAPFDPASLTQRVSSVTRGADGVAKVGWSRAEGPGITKRATGSIVTIPAGLIANGESIVMSETGYYYESPVKYVLKEATHFENTFYLRPRQVQTVACSNCPT